MVELSQKKQLKRDSKPFPLMNLIHGSNNSIVNKKEQQHRLGSGLISPKIISNSIVRQHRDPYMPHIPQRSQSSVSLPQPQSSKHHNQRPVRRSVNSSTPRPFTPTTESQHIHHHHYYFSPSSPTTQQPQQPFYNLYSDSNSQLSPLSSPPPLSPTNVSFATRPSWRDIKRSPTWQPASSISSSEQDDGDDDDDGDNGDNEPLYQLATNNTRPFSLLSDASEDGDDDLIPIARLSISSPMSAAEKYKAKVRAKLQMDNTCAFV